MTDAPALHYGRTAAEWDEMTAAGLRFLTERAALGRPTNYTELSNILVRRTGARRFDFDLESERAAMGHLLYLIVERDRPETGLMISALVWYLNDNNPGPGFYGLAHDYDELPKNATEDQKLAFWADQVRRLEEHHRRRRR